MNSILNSVSAQDLRRAADIKERIDALQHELATILGSQSVVSNPNAGRRKMNAAARARIAAGARARWARERSHGHSTATRKKRSPAVRARLAAIARERWRKAKAAGKSTL
jgi:hypothetical protein